MAERKYRFVSIIMFTLRPDALSLNGSIMITHTHTPAFEYAFPTDLRQHPFSIDLLPNLGKPLCW